MRHLSIAIAGAVAALIGGCENSPPASSIYAPSSAQYQQAPEYTQYSTQAPPPDPSYDSAADSDYPDQAYESVYIDPPLEQPPPVSIDWAPPPMLDEAMPPQPYPDAIWTGGYWVWQDNWVWARGRWSSPPQRGYRWVRPYYEHRGNSVIFINGFWCAPGVSFHRPPPNIVIPRARVRPGVARGPRPIGPEGAFLPPPHGARRGLIVPASEPQPQAPRAQQDRGRQEDQRRDQNRDRGQEQVRTPPPVPGALRPANEPNTPPSMRPNDADRGQRNRDRNPQQQSRPSQPAVIPGAPQTQHNDNRDAQHRRSEQDAAQRQQQQQQQERTQQQRGQQQQQERAQQQQQQRMQQQERTQQQQQRMQQQQERVQQQQQRMQQQQQQQRVQQMQRPQPQIEQHAPPRVAPPRENPPPAARPAPRPAAEPRDEQPREDRGRGRGHD
jgi:hypothetical protein